MDRGDLREVYGRAMNAGGARGQMARQRLK